MFLKYLILPVSLFNYLQQSRKNDINFANTTVIISNIIQLYHICQYISMFYINNNIKMYLERLVIDNIKRIRKEKGISQEKLAESCNTATSYIGLMEIYKNVPKLSTIERIANALDVDPLIFFQDREKIPFGYDAEMQSKKDTFLLVIKKGIDNIFQ